MRDSQYKSYAAQNQFTAYLLAAIRNCKRTYLKKHADVMLMELPFERYTETSEVSDEPALFDAAAGKWAFACCHAEPEQTGTLHIPVQSFG